MDRLKTLLQGIARAARRFPLTVLCVVGAAGLLMYDVASRAPTPPTVTKLLFTLAVGTVLGLATQFALERYAALARRRLLVYVAAALAVAGYALIIWPLSAVSGDVGLRTFVATFAMLAAAVWFPAHGERADFNRVVLAHLMAAFTAVLYGIVLSAGIAAIIAAIDGLLIPLPGDTYTHAFILIWVLFVTVCYLSLLPRFHPATEAEAELLRDATACPRLLDILISYIAVPLVGVYTLVLFLYFLKMLITFTWPVGQLGPLALWYEAAGLVVLVLAALPDNRFAAVYRRLFPRVLVPIVITQLVSVGIRLDAYGVTVSRYYVALFGVLSLLLGVVLTWRPAVRHSLIALLAAVFAVFSIVPPLDAFTVAQASQTRRLETVLTTAGMLRDGQLTPDPEADLHTRVETTDILQYLNRTSSLKDLAWLPPDFSIYRDMDKTFGFEPTYPQPSAEKEMYFYAMLDTEQPLDISGFDALVPVEAGRWRDKTDTPLDVDLTIRGQPYQLLVQRQSPDEVRLALVSATGEELVSTGLHAFAEQLRASQELAEDRPALAPAKMTFDAMQNGHRLRVVFQNVYISSDPGNEGADYTVTVLVGLPD